VRWRKIRKRRENKNLFCEYSINCIWLYIFAYVFLGCFILFWLSSFAVRWEIDKFMLERERIYREYEKKLMRERAIKRAIIRDLENLEDTDNCVNVIRYLMERQNMDSVSIDKMYRLANKIKKYKMETIEDIFAKSPKNRGYDPYERTLNSIARLGWFVLDTVSTTNEDANNDDFVFHIVILITQIHINFIMEIMDTIISNLSSDTTFHNLEKYDFEPLGEIYIQKSLRCSQIDTCLKNNLPSQNFH